MNFKILKKDLKRKKSMNLILLIFIFLATTFIAGSLNNLAVVTNGLDYFMEQSQIADFIVVMMGGSPGNLSDSEIEVENFLRKQENVTEYTADDILYLTKSQIRLEQEKEFALNTTVLINSCNAKQQLFFDSGNNQITEMEDGTIYLPRRAVTENDLEPGDIIYIQTDGGYQKSFRLMGYFKDAFLGSDMMGTQRYLVSDADFKEMLEKSDMSYGRLYSAVCDDLEAFERDYNNVGFYTVFGEDIELIKRTYVMDMIVAAVLLVVSLCLVIISILMLRFTIAFTINEDYKEIGIMKAIGIGDRAIRKLYLSKYLALAAAGAALGFAASIPFSRAMLAQVMENIVVEDGGTGGWLQIAAGFFVAFSVVFFAWLATGKIRRFTPMDAIRNGNSGERFKRKGMFHLAGSRLRVTTFMAYNDVVSELKKYLVLLATSAVGVWLVIMPVNSINTLRSDNIGAWFSLTHCDFVIVDDERLSKLVLGGDRQQHYDYLDEIETELENAGIDVSRVVMEAVLRCRIRHGEDSCNSLSFQGLRTSTDEYFYDDGMAPVYENEVAITHVVAEKIHAQIGDTVYIGGQGEEKPYIVTAIYQSMNNMGEGIRFPESADINYAAVSGGFGVQATLKGQPDKKELSDVIETVQKLMPQAKVQPVSEFISDMIGGIEDSLDFLKLFILGLVIAVNILVVVLMQKMFLIRERGEMGMLKSVGFSDRAIIGWQTKRIMLVLFLGILLGTLTGTPFSRVTAGELFKIVGVSKIEFSINVPEVYLVYPAVLFAATVLGCVLAMRSVRKISVQEVNNIE